MCPLTDAFAGYDWLIKHGGRPMRRAPEPESQPEPLIPESAHPEAEEPKPTVALRDLKWGKEAGVFGRKSRISVHADLPTALKHATRIQFTLFAPDAQGKPEKLIALEGHLENGEAHADFELPHTQGKDGATEPGRTFTCVAKHRDSEPLESAKHTAKEVARLELSLDDAQAWKKAGYRFCLGQAGGEHMLALKAEDGEERDGKLTLRFEDLDATAKYTLEIRDEMEDKLRQVVFKERKYGDWREEAAKGAGARE